MDKIILYTIACPNCNVLKRKLDEKGIEYELVDDGAILSQLKSDHFPQLKVGNEILDFYSAIRWLKEKG